MSKIEWTGKTWNPTIGCTEVSRGCLNCYAAKMAYRLMHMPAMANDYEGIAKRLPNGKIVFTGLVKELPERLAEPLNTKKATTYFVDSMSDLFHADVSWNYLYKVFEIMLLTPHHTYQVLTKRHEGLNKLEDVYFHLKRNYPERFFKGNALPNVIIGVSVENQKHADERIPALIKCSLRGFAHKIFLSCEPLVGALNLNAYYLTRSNGSYAFPYVSENSRTKWIDLIDWVIVGGESGTGHKMHPVHPDWIRQIQQQCAAAGVPFFFKQWGNWLPFYDREIDDPDWRNVPKEIPGKIRFMNLDGNWGFHGERVIYFKNVGKAAAGAMLDGKEYRELPITTTDEHK